MSSNKYTLDRFEGEYAVFLKRPDETEQLIIHRNDIQVAVKQGDIVQISDDGESYKIEVLEAETKAAQDRINDLLARLRKNK
ncbi:MAG: DUF3006 domain-containing protein [Lysinibacillus sp.]